MRMVVVALILFVFGFAGERSLVAQDAGPLLDERFCADSNGDGKVDISDPVTVLSSLFSGDGTRPYCIRDGVNIGAQLAELEASLAAANDANAATTNSLYCGPGPGTRAAGPIRHHPGFRRFPAEPRRLQLRDRGGSLDRNRH